MTYSIKNIILAKHGSLMKKTFTIAAIAMFAVVLGMGALSPALAAPNNEKSSATTAVCHYFEEYLVDEAGEPILDENGEPIVDEEASSWDVLYVSSKGAEKGHTKHGDETITTEAEALACVANQDGSIETIPEPTTA